MSEPDSFELQQARAAIWELAKFGGQNTQLAMRYVSLFAPINDKLPFDEFYRLLREINGICLDCSAGDWQKAVQKLLSDKVSGSLKTPLDSHDLLLEGLEIVQSFQNTESESTTETAPIVAPSAVAREPPEPFISPSPEQKQARHELNQSMIKKLNCKIFS